MGGRGGREGEKKRNTQKRPSVEGQKHMVYQALRRHHRDTHCLGTGHSSVREQELFHKVKLHNYKSGQWLSVTRVSVRMCLWNMGQE